MNRETIYSALFSKVSSAANFTTVARRLRHEGDVPREEMPALFQLQAGEDINRLRGVPPSYTLSVELWLYAHADDTEAPSSVLNPLIDAVTAALEPSLDSDTQTLGLANVSHCWISGRIEIFEGILGNTAIAIIPVNILAT